MHFCFYSKQLIEHFINFFYIKLVIVCYIIWISFSFSNSFCFKFNNWKILLGCVNISTMWSFRNLKFFLLCALQHDQILWWFFAKCAKNKFHFKFECYTWFNLRNILNDIKKTKKKLHIKN